MKIELTQQDCQNVRVALTLLAKAPHTSAEEMKVALILSDKFTLKEDVKPEAVATEQAA